MYWHLLWLVLFHATIQTNGFIKLNDTKALRDKALEMFDHAYNSYMVHAFPADELMPLSCQGRYRGNKPSRGDVDDSLGNFTLTLVDSLDTLALLGRLEEFETAVRLVLEQTSFDTNVVVSVFETNIRMLGGLLGGHVAAVDLKKQGKCCHWYTDQLLDKALDLGERLLLAFDTVSGIPYPKVNLVTGLKNLKVKDTCTACAGTMVLEFAALSRLTGDTRFEEAAHKAMDFLWDQRNVHSNLMGTVLNINNGDWVRRESGIGAGIDSYYEYLLKAYILLGDDAYLTRFNKHYDAIMTYINQGPIMLNVDMHKPTVSGRNIMDSLLAFWPGLQVLKGDLKSAIEMHEVLYQITQRHTFLPEAVTSDFHVHWGQHPLRPEFVESTYFLYKATGDPHYRDVGRTVLEKLEQHARVPCGFAAIKDVRGNTHEDQMDSFVLAETFKYLYLLFEEEENLTLDVSQYVFTTEAHILPLSLANHSFDSKKAPTAPKPKGTHHDHSCPNIRELSSMSVIRYAQSLRTPLHNYVELKCPKPKPSRTPRVRAQQFLPGDIKQAQTLESMGIQLVNINGRVQLTHSPTKADSTELAEEGLAFMKEMLELAQSQQELLTEPRIVQIMFTNQPTRQSVVLEAGPAQFGWDFVTSDKISNHYRAYKEGFRSSVVKAKPLDACKAIQNSEELSGNIVLVSRGDCTFVDKARACQNAGAVGVIVMDNVIGSSKAENGFFQMSGDDVDDVTIPVVFLFSTEAAVLTNLMINKRNDLQVYLAKVKDAEYDKKEKPLHTRSPKKQEYPRSIITSADPELMVFVETKSFRLTLTIMNNLKEGSAPEDFLETSMSDGLLTLELAPARIFKFDMLSETFPSRGELSEAIADLIISHLEKCPQAEEPEEYIDTITAVANYIYQPFEEEEEAPQNPVTESEVYTLIKELRNCATVETFRKESEKDENGNVKVSNLETPHVGELPDFYFKPSNEHSVSDDSANKRRQYVNEFKGRDNSDNSGSEDDEMRQKPPIQVAPPDIVTSEEHVHIYIKDDPSHIYPPGIGKPPHLTSKNSQNTPPRAVDTVISERDGVQLTDPIEYWQTNGIKPVEPVNEKMEDSHDARQPTSQDTQAKDEL
ncbi:ER degradation-enhancing alpha-mannosidase-like protein 3 isoform X2 [Watersipora subatra]|uniref:ER degradation-enhancing alpha-mannosidase-like protein 3 isoform X2 n=1 Tax=Watersipora subatra TaxID=2589382 RepID=UPI00355C2707